MSEDLVISDVNDICRLCLKGDGTIIPIFGRENTSRDCIPLSKKILDCVSIKVSDGDGLPSMICVGCVHQVDSWHGFKNVCDSSNNKLMSWLQKTRPDIYEKNLAENRRQNQRMTQSSTIIDLSSDDDEIIITQPLVRKISDRNEQRIRHRPSSHRHNIELISLGTDEIEILPIDDGRVCEKGNSHLQNNNIPSGTPEHSTNDDVTESDVSEDHILPDVPENDEDEEDTPSKDNTGVRLQDNDLQKETTSSNILSETPECEQSKENENVEQVQINDFSVMSENNNSGPQEVDALAENCNESQDPLDNADSANWSPSEVVRETSDIEGIVPLNKSSGDVTKRVVNDTTTTVDENSSSTNKENSIEKLNEVHAENTVENNSSLVIEEVTSLTNHDCERVAASSSSWDRDVQEEVSGDEDDLRPDIIMCDPSMVLNIKEEPLSAGEITGDEDDPLNFQSITIKTEPLDWTTELVDVKPSVRMLNEAMDNQYLQYTPKRLKCGKVYCEPCRVSFINDVYYDRHTKSLRHKLNYKLFRSGKAPTRKRGKTLVQAIMGNSYDERAGAKGPFYCNQCPSAFKHLRNLKTHMKKHQAPGQTAETASQDSRDSQPSTHSEGRSSKPPTRLSALNVRFTDCDEINQCDLCDQTFLSLPALVSHKRFCGTSDTRVCNWCQQNFTTTSLFMKHRKECLKRYRQQQVFNASQYNLVKSSPSPVPMSTSSSTPVPRDGTVLACTLCNLTFQSSPDLISHMQQNHMDFGKPRSPAELPNFTKPNHFSRLNDSRLHYCKYCLRSFPSHGALASHTGYHARKSVYCCKFCKQSFRDKLTFRQHMKVHIGDPNLNRNICWICYTPFSSQKDLIDHKAVHVNIKMKIFSCGLCNNSYNTRELLAKHKKTAHDVGSTEAFDEESEQVTESEMRRESKVEIMDEDNKLFKCRICKKRFTTIGNLKRHGLIHKRPVFMSNLSALSSEHSYQHRCVWCFKTFKTNSGLLNHRPYCTKVKTGGIPFVNSAFPGNGTSKPLRCKGCKKWFASKNSLYKHRVMKRCRGPPPPPPLVMVSQLRSQACPSCDQQFLSEESLNRHKQHCKPTIERLTCDCGEVFGSIEQKVEHADACVSNCTCKNCNVKFNSPEELESHQLVCQTHVQTQREEPVILEDRLPPVVCTKCNKKFVYAKCLQIHEDKCLYDRWPCSNCMEIFPTESALNTHKSHKTCQRLNRALSSNSLNDSQTLKCEKCALRFVSITDLKQHSASCEKRPPMRRRDLSSVHRPFSCDLCDKAFLWKANLIRHKKIIHQITNSFTGESSAHNLTSPAKSESPVFERETGVFKCALCPDIVFHKQQGLLEHQLTHERQDGNRLESSSGEGTGSGVMLTCELCDKQLPEALYPMHMDEHMNDDFEEMQEAQHEVSSPKFACDICGKEFYTAQSRKSHRATHYRAGDVLAHLSPKKVQSKRTLKVKHIRCNICNKLLSINSMPKHKMMHLREEAEFYGNDESSSQSKSVANTPRSSTPNLIELTSSPEDNEEDGNSIFPCPKCDKTFRLRKSLIEHLKAHQEDSYETESTSSNTGPADQYPYKCLYCDLSWKFKSVYERHLGSKKHLEIQKQLSGII
ncbi:zinc finger protein 62-like [Homalodisca vitripennis]|nr:zinc finger protein 62-like [Homalodisca vitripennis]